MPISSYQYQYLSHSDYRESEKTHLSDVFTFAGICFRLSFTPESSSSECDGFSLLLILAQPACEAIVSCEFKVHAPLRQSFCRPKKNLRFSSTNTLINGFKHFMGMELLSYLEDGTMTFSVIMKSCIDSKGRLIGIPEDLIMEEKLSSNGTKESNDGIPKIQGKREAEVECRMDEIYPQSCDELFHSNAARIVNPKFNEDSKHFNSLNTTSSSWATENQSMHFYPKVLSPSWRPKLI
jgi:hypothetical protein